MSEYSYKDKYNKSELERKTKNGTINIRSERYGDKCMTQQIKNIVSLDCDFGENSNVVNQINHNNHDLISQYSHRQWKNEMADLNEEQEEVAEVVQTQQELFISFLFWLFDLQEYDYLLFKHKINGGTYKDFGEKYRKTKKQSQLSLTQRASTHWRRMLSEQPIIEFIGKKYGKSVKEER